MNFKLKMSTQSARVNIGFVFILPLKKQKEAGSSCHVTDGELHLGDDLSLFVSCGISSKYFFKNTS